MTAPVAAAQLLAEQLMRDTCTVTRPSSSDGPLDPDTGLPAETAGTTVYSGVCRLRMSAAVSASAARNVGGDSVSVSAPMLSVPVSAARLVPGDVVAITAVPVGDPAGHLRLGLRLRVVGLVIGQDMSAQRVTVEAVTG